MEEQEGNPADRQTERETGRTQDASVLQKEEAQRGLPEETGISTVPGKNSMLMSQCFPADRTALEHPGAGAESRVNNRL